MTSVLVLELAIQGIPFIIPLFISESLSEKILNIIDGLVMTGGCGSSDKDDRIEVKEKQELYEDKTRDGILLIDIL